MDEARPETPPPGAYSGVPFSTYGRWKGTNWSLLKPFSVSALNGRHKMLIPPDATADQVFGAAFHTAILEPELFASIHATMPEFPGHHNSNAYKALKNEWVEANREKVHLTGDEMRRLAGMQKSVMAHPTTHAILEGKGKNELSLVWVDEETKQTCKGRLDRLTRIEAKYLDATATGNAICIVDFKKTSCIERFQYDIAKWAYHGQAAFYRDGVAAIERINPETITSILVAVQDDEPYDVVPYLLTDAVVHGQRLYRRLLRTYVQCKRQDAWPGICPKGCIPAILPRWSEEGEEPT